MDFLLDIMEVNISILVRNRAGELKEVTSCSLIGFSTSLGVLVRERSSAFPRVGSRTLKSEPLEPRFGKRLSPGYCYVVLGP